MHTVSSVQPESVWSSPSGLLLYSQTASLACSICRCRKLDDRNLQGHEIQGNADNNGFQISGPNGYGENRQLRAATAKTRVFPSERSLFQRTSVMPFRFNSVLLHFHISLLSGTLGIPLKLRRLITFPHFWQLKLHMS